MSAQLTGSKGNPGTPIAPSEHGERQPLFSANTLVEPLLVYREIHDRYQLVGRLEPQADGARFAYVPQYCSGSIAASEPSVPISRALPLQSMPFSPKETRSFFENLLPEGDVRRILGDAMRDREAAYPRLLQALNHESSGALVFAGNGDEPWENQAYEPCDFALLEAFAREPTRVAAELDLSSHLSLAGAQAKIGLYHKGTDPHRGWFVPRGTAPTTHIVKAGDPLLEHEAINEALCLETARRCGFDVEKSFLVPIEGEAPLLAVSRFDRVLPRVEDSHLRVSELPRPRRRHQEDLLQALSLPSWARYEVTGQPNAPLVSGLLQRNSANPLRDRMTFFRLLVFDLLVGNCDNHLKNHSLLWDKDWRECRLSPVYDIVNTRAYGFRPEMAIAFSASRRIDDVVWDDVTGTAWEMGFPVTIAARLFDEVADRFLAALDEAERSITAQGFPEVMDVAPFIALEARVRLERIAATRSR